MHGLAAAGLRGLGGRVFDARAKLLDAIFFLRAVGTKSGTRDPSAQSRPEQISAFGLVWSDAFRWMQKRNDELNQYISSERRYFEARLGSDLADLQTRVFNRALELDSSQGSTEPQAEVIGQYKYVVTSSPDQPYDHYLREPLSGRGKLESVLDLNLLACTVSGPFQLGQIKISDSHRLLAYTISERIGPPCATVKMIATGEVVDQFGDVHGLEWFGDNKTLLYTSSGGELRPSKVLKRRIAMHSQAAEVVIEEAREDCFLSLTKSKDNRYIFINSNSKTSSEVHVVDAACPDATPVLIHEREDGLEYFVEHWQERLIILTNAGARNNCLMTAPPNCPAKSQWELLVPERDSVAIEDVDVFEDCAILWERHSGLPSFSLLWAPHKCTSHGLKRQLGSSPNDAELSAAQHEGQASGSCQKLKDQVVRRRNSLKPVGWGSSYIESFVFRPEGGCTHLRPAANADAGAKQVKVYGSSPLLPETTLQVSLQIPGSPAPVTPHRLSRPRPQLQCWQELAVSADGTQIPITLAADTGATTSGSSQTTACLFQLYGAYGMCVETGFNPAARVLVDKGWTLATAHVRGGGELGRSWHHAGRQQGKLLALEDAQACAELLIARGLASRGALALRAESAGGVLAGNLLLSRPQLFGAAALRMPFLDLFTAMMDSSQALTQHEWEEWGDPRMVGGTQLLQQLCPYQGIARLSEEAAASMPPVLVTAGVRDDRAPVWMAAKWVAALRARLGSRQSVWLNVHEGGHFLTQEDEAQLDALEAAFLLDSMRIT